MKLTPFRERLIYALGLKTNFDEEGGKEGGKESEQGEESKKSLYSEKKDRKLFKKESTMHLEVNNMREFKEYGPKVLITAYITFGKFVKFLDVFAPKSSFHAKAKCTPHEPTDFHFP